MSSINHSRNVILNLSLDKTFDLCMKSITSIKRGKIINEDRETGIINAKGGITWKSFGEKIDFKIQKINENQTKVEFSSKPSSRTTLVDYGKNLQNILTIEEIFEGNISINNQA